MTSAAEALERLIEGNRRFVAGDRAAALNQAVEREALVDEQAPFAVVLGCSDSRVAPELVFDQGLGSLFVVRTAGHVATTTELGSVELAVDHLGARLVMVLGHSGCGAVQATLSAIEGSESFNSPNLSHLIKNIRPSVEPLAASADSDLLDRAVRANVQATVRHLHEHVQRDEVIVVAPVYSLETGAVELLEASA